MKNTSQAKIGLIGIISLSLGIIIFLSGPELFDFIIIYKYLGILPILALYILCFYYINSKYSIKENLFSNSSVNFGFLNSSIERPIILLLIMRKVIDKTNDIRMSN